MKKQIQKKLSAFIFIAMMLSVSANAQIVYTDVIPDTQIDSTNTVYHLDLNNDGITDYNITYTKITQIISCGGNTLYTNYFITVEPLDSNEVGRDVIGSNGFPAALVLHSPIGGTLYTWLNGGSRALAFKAWSCGGWGLPQPYEYSGGYFLNASNKYLALRLHVASQVYYGWVSLSVAIGVINATIFDYAYNSSPGQSILAGQITATGIIENSFAAGINIYPNPATDKLTIALGSNNKKVEVTIINITGKIIYKTSAFEAQKIEVNTQDISAGICVVQIQTADFIAAKKIMVEK